MILKTFWKDLLCNINVILMKYINWIVEEKYFYKLFNWFSAFINIVY